MISLSFETNPWWKYGSGEPASVHHLGCQETARAATKDPGVGAEAEADAGDVST